MKKRMGISVLVVCCAAAASFGQADPGQENCGQLLVSPDRAMLGIEYELEAEGLRVKGVVPGGPAEKAGLAAGDLIVQINGDALLFRDRVGAAKWLDRYQAGQALDVAVYREGVTSSFEIRGDRITCRAAERLDRLLRAAESEGLEGCATGEAAATAPPEDPGPDPMAVFMDKLPAEPVVVSILRAGREGSPIRIETDVPLRGEPLELGSLPGFMQELAGRLREGESVSFRVTLRTAPRSRTARYEILSFPERFADSWAEVTPQELLPRFVTRR